MYQILGGGVLYSDIKSVWKANNDLTNFVKKLVEGNKRLEKKLDNQSDKSENHFETIKKNHGEVDVSNNDFQCIWRSYQFR